MVKVWTDSKSAPCTLGDFFLNRSRQKNHTVHVDKSRQSLVTVNFADTPMCPYIPFIVFSLYVLIYTEICHRKMVSPQVYYRAISLVLQGSNAVVVTGGYDKPNSFLDSTEIYWLSNHSWTQGWPSSSSTSAVNAPLKKSSCSFAHANQAPGCQCQWHRYVSTHILSQS